ncbi:hypothetical protein SDC9_20426 [bioreactor metagenome]|uniref:Uncharacterized protein n=1 Tax=bioreactor metagenome TaxID=1076179 RepID=A0A644U6Q5_9ZZZZ
MGYKIKESFEKEVHPENRGALGFQFAFEEA